MSEVTTLSDVCTTIVDCEHKTVPEAAQGTEYGYSVGTPHIRNGRILLEAAKRVDEETYLRWTAREVPRDDDLVLAREAPVGQVGRITNGQKICLGQRTVLLRPEITRVDPRYLHYLLLSPAVQGDMASKAAGSTVPHLNVKDIRELPLPPLPPKPYQAAVAATLGALDDKIAVNERIAATTDKLVSARFSALMASCLAPEEVFLGEVAAVNPKSVKSSPEGKLRYIDISSVGVGFYEWPDSIEWSEAPGRARRKAAPGSTIWSTVRPNRRSHALVLDEDADLVFSTGLAVLTPLSVGPAFLYETTRTPEFQAYLESVAEGSAYPAVRAERFKEATFLLPEPAEREKFEESAMAMRQHAHQAALESRVLATLRDALLPQVMSGRLRVKDAEKIVEDNA